MAKIRWAAILGVAAVMTGSALAPPAQACGGFFCSQAAPVNQAAERIVFAHNDDGTVTAVIEIMYQGPSENFSWLLPISSVPQEGQIAVASKSSFDRLQTLTNPQYTLTTRIEGECDTEPPILVGTGGTTSTSFPGASAGSGGGSNGGVTVEASGVVGAFEWTVISLDASLESPADAAVMWLGDNGYDVPEGAPGLLGPYLEDGLNLLALRLQKGRDTGSIRPIALTYEATRPMIPIKLTAVAANDDMGVMTWVLAEDQAVPQNYYALELNEARINWFNANSTYNSVVIAAADEASGQGFVTEYAQPTTALSGLLWSEGEESNWTTFVENAPSLGENLVPTALNLFSSYDGFWDVFRALVTLPAEVTVEQVQQCPFCGFGPMQADPTELVAALETEVIVPARLVQELFDAHPSVTRLYTTMSAAEMTVDPLFTFNPDLEPVSNVHTAERVVECSAGYYVGTAPWRIELPQGGVIRGGPSQFGAWPAELAELPANRRILRQGESGPGQILEDNSESIDEAVETYSSTVETPAPRADDPDAPGADGPNGPDAPLPYGNPYVPGGGGGGGCGCRIDNSRRGIELAWMLVAGCALALLRRRSSRAS